MPEIENLLSLDNGVARLNMTSYGSGNVLINITSLCDLKDFARTESKLDLRVVGAISG